MYDWYIIFLFTLLQLTFISFFSSLPNHFHQDEFITAFASFDLPSLFEIDWFAGYPSNWVARFPIIFHILQWPFVHLFPSVASVRISIWPYLIATNIFLYFFIRNLFSGNFAVITLAVYSLFSPTLYLFSMGLHFASSMCFYMGTLYFFSRIFKTGNQLTHFAFGLFLALSYLTYTSSYVSLPVVLLSLTLCVILEGRRDLLPKFGRALIVSGVILFPFFIYATTVQNYFTERALQVNALWGSWSDSAKLLEQGENPSAILLSQLQNSALSVVVPGIGGAGGYWFGKLALLDKFTALLFMIGLCVSIVRFIKNRELQSGIITVAFLIPFLAIFAFTSHPPNFQRLSVTYPILSIFVSMPIYVIFHKLIGKNYFLGLLFTSICIVVLGITNIRHVIHMINSDSTMYPQNTRVIAQFINDRVPAASTIYIAAFPSFHVGQELTFRTNHKYAIKTDAPEYILPDYKGNTVLIILNADTEIIDHLSTIHQNNSIVTSLYGTHLGDLTLVVPKNLLKRNDRTD